MIFFFCTFLVVRSRVYSSYSMFVYFFIFFCFIMIVNCLLRSILIYVFSKYFVGNFVLETASKLFRIRTQEIYGGERKQFCSVTYNSGEQFVK